VEEEGTTDCEHYKFMRWSKDKFKLKKWK